MPMPDNSTSDIKLLRQQKRPKFTWGSIIEIMDIGPYTIASYHPHKNDNGRISSQIIDVDRTQFHGWVDGENSHRAWLSLDEALVGLIAYRAEGPNSRAADYFKKMIANEES